MITKHGSGGVTVANANPTSVGPGVDFNFVASGSAPPPFVNEYSTECVALSTLNAGTSCRFAKTDPYSISVWAKNDSAAGAAVLYPFVCNETAGINGIFFYDSYPGGAGQTGITLEFLGNGTYIYVITNVSGLRDVWNHYVVTYDGSNSANGVKFYLNGAAVTPITNPLYMTIVTGPNYATDTTYAARTSGGAERFRGKLDEITTWDVELSAAQVALLYNSGVPNNPTTNPAGTPGSWYRMGDSPDTTSLIADQTGSFPIAATNITFSTDVPT